jgi:hypothetical protein
MNLLVVVPGGVHPSGEIEVIPTLLNLCRLLSEQHKVVIIALHQHTELTEYQLVGCQVISLAMVKTTNLPTSFLTSLKRLKHYGFCPDVVHSFWLGKPTLLAAMLSKKFKAPLLASIAGGESVNIPEIGYGGSKTLISRWFNALGVKLADATSCGSRFVQAKAEQRWGIEPQIIPLGIDLAFWPLTTITDKPIKQWQLLQIASINAVKDPWLLLDIVDELKQAEFDFHLNWAGEDTLNGAVHKQARERGLTEFISFHGFKTQKQLKQMVAGQHFVIQTSRYESQGIAMAEAVSQGLCPVGTDVGWLNDLGMGLPTADIAQQIMRLAQDFEARKATVIRVQDWIKGNDLAITVEQFNEYYLSLYPVDRVGLKN